MVRNRHNGFTIVELLIVIVVIGILAAITIVAYNGIQQRARNAQTISAVEAYQKGLAAYALLNGSYPNYNYVCLGQGNPGGTCWYGGNSDSVGFSDALRTTMGGSLPLAGFGGNATGAMFVANAMTIDGVPRAILFYTIDTTGDPSPKCPLGPIISGSGYPTLLTSNSVGAVSIGANECWIPLPDAKKL